MNYFTFKNYFMFYKYVFTYIYKFYLLRKVKKGILQKIKISKKGKVPLDYHSPGAILVQDLLNSTRHDFDIINTPLKLEESDCLPDSSSSSFSRFFKRSFSFKSKPTISRSMSTTELWRKHPSAFRF